MLSDTEDETEVTELPTKKLKSLERVIMGKKLSDIEINSSQRILKSKFPEINGLESTLLQAKNHISKEPNHNKLQVIHCKEILLDVKQE